MKKNESWAWIESVVFIAKRELFLNILNEGTKTHNIIACISNLPRHVTLKLGHCMNLYLNHNQ